MQLQWIRRPARVILIGVLSVCVAAWAGLHAQESDSRELLKRLAAEASHGPVYTVTQVLVDFDSSVPTHPTLEEVMALEVNLGVSPSGYTDPEESPKFTTVKLSEVGGLENPRFHASALRRICQRIGAFFGEQGLAGLNVTTHARDIDEHGRDLRGKDQTALRLIVTAEEGAESKSENPKSETRNPKPEGVDEAPAGESPKSESPIAKPEGSPRFVEVPQEESGGSGATLGGGSASTDEAGALAVTEAKPASAGENPKSEIRNPKVEEREEASAPLKEEPAPAPVEEESAPAPAEDEAAPAPVEEESAPAPVPASDSVNHGPTYTVSQFILAFDPEIPSRPPMREVMSYPIEVSESETGYTAPVEGAEVIKVKLSEVQAKLSGKPWHMSGIKAVCASVNLQLEIRGFPRLRVVINEDDVNTTGEDVRAQNQSAMRLYVEPRRAEPPAPPQVARATEPKPQPKPEPKPQPKPEPKPEVKPEPKPDGEQARPLTPVPVPPVVTPQQLQPQPVAPAPPPVPTAPRVTTFVEATGTDGAAYPVSQIILEYSRRHPANPDLHEILEYAGTHLAETPEGFVAAEAGSANAKFVRVVDLPVMGNPRLFASAIQAYSKSIAKVYVDRGFVGIRVAPHAEDISSDLKDQRPEGINALRLVVTLGEVRRLRTVGIGPRIQSGMEPVNNPIHRRILAQAPVKGSDASTGTRGDLLQRQEMDEYARRLSRHPGRSVTVGVTPDAAGGGTALDIDLFVAEAKPWNLYAQVSNTGTEQTNEWRQRFGFVHNQVSNFDDIFRVDYITSSFDDQHAVLASYEAPLLDLDRLRWRVSGLYSTFTASDVGAANVDFDGDQYWMRGDVIANVYQNGPLFIDVFAGARYQQDRVDVSAPGLSEGRESFIIPHVGVQAERFTTTARTAASVQYELNATGGDEDELSSMGRLMNDPVTGDFIGEEDFGRLTWDAYHSFYLEPLFYTPGVDAAPRKSLLAHELFFAFRGQYSGDRNIPQFQRTVGGFQSVRGYDESAAAGDTALIFTAEYRFHVPHAFCFDKPGELMGKPFRYAPSQVYGGTDWDLVLRGFFDYAKVYNNDVPTLTGGGQAELDEFEMASVGVGAELLFKGNLSLRVDYGYVLKEVRGIADEGDSRVHFMATIVY